MAAIYGSGMYAESGLRCKRFANDVLRKPSRTRYSLAITIFLRVLVH